MLERIRGLMFVLKPVIDPFRPALSRALFTLLGIIIGIFLVYTGGFGLVDVEWRDAEPVHLQESWREQWVKNAALARQYYLEHGADPESVNESTAEDLEGAGYDSAKVQELAENEADQVVSTALGQVAELPDNAAAEAKAAQVSTSFWDTIGPCLCVFSWLLILVLVGIGLSFKPIPIGKWKKGPIARDERTEAAADAERARRLAAKEARELAAAAAAQAAVDFGEPEATFTSTYVLGDDHFSYSYPIEPGGGFAGEVGIEIGKTIGEGSPKKVTAFDVFIFDQKDIQTLTYLITSEHAYVDDTLRAQLAPRAEEMIVPQQGESFIMETRNLRMKVQILQMEYGEGSLPPNSFFGKLIVQLTVWLKEGGSDAGGDSLSAMPPLPRPVMDMPMAPPPMPPAPATEQRPPMATPLAPPPMQPPAGGGFAPPPPPQPLTSNQPMQPPAPPPPPPSSDPFGGQQPPLPPQRQPGPGAGAPPPPPPPRPPAGGQQPGMSAPPPPPRPAPMGPGVPPPPPRPGGQPMQPGMMPPPPPPRPQGQQPGVPLPPPPPLGRQPDEEPPDLDDPFGDTTNM